MRTCCTCVWAGSRNAARIAPYPLRSWCRYLEAPAGVGFSYSTDPADYTTDDFQVADDNYHALQFFFTEKFPELADNDFVVTGESYGGIYVPSLTVRILTGNAAGTGQKINIKGFAVGNGVSSYAFNTNSLIYYVYYHGFIGPELWATLSANCNGNFANPPNAACNNAVNAANDIVYNSGLNFYGWEMECAPGSPEGDLRQALAMETLFHGSSLTPPPVKTLDATSLGEDVPCINSTAGTMYLNRPDVRAALHISPLAHDWAICFGGLNYNRTILDITPYWSKALAAGMHGSIYNGDTDMACNVLGDEWAVSSLDLPTDGPRSAWHTDGQVAGFFQAYKGGMDFWTVKGSGHMVPQFKPPQAEFMFHTILQRTGVIPSSSSSTQLDDSGAFQDDKEGSPVRLRGLAQE